MGLKQEVRYRDVTNLTRSYLGNKIYENGVLKMILTDEGYVTRENGAYKHHYYIRDYLGNNRLVVDGSGNVEQKNYYYPFGLPNTYGTAQEDQPYKFNGKELDRMMGMNWYDYSARFYDGAIGRFTTQDPLAEKYYSISPYAYCNNNPVNFIDPTGMLIDSLSIDQWNIQKDEITSQRDDLVKDNNNGKNDARVTSLNETLNNMSLLEVSDQVYSLQAVKGDIGQLKLNPTNGNMIIEYTNTANFVHEVTHGAQFESGDIGFSTQTGMVIANDLWDEAAAYTAQFNYNTSSIGGINEASQITSQWVSNITISDGSKPYGVGGVFNVGQRMLNANSTMTRAFFAYPHLRQQIISSGSLLNQVPFRNYLNYRFK